MSNKFNRELDANVDRITTNIEALRREEELQTSSSLRIVIYLLEESILNQFEVLQQLKNKRTKGPLVFEDVEKLVPKLRLSGKMLENIVTQYLSHDAEQHVEVDDE